MTSSPMLIIFVGLDDMARPRMIVLLYNWPMRT